MKIFRRKGAANDGRATDSDVRAAFLLAAMRAFREAEKARTGAEVCSREDLLIAEFAEPVVVPAPLCESGR